MQQAYSIDQNINKIYDNRINMWKFTSMTLNVSKLKFYAFLCFALGFTFMPFGYLFCAKVSFCISSNALLSLIIFQTNEKELNPSITATLCILLIIVDQLRSTLIQVLIGNMIQLGLFSILERYRHNSRKKIDESKARIENLKHFSPSFNELNKQKPETTLSIHLPPLDHEPAPGKGQKFIDTLIHLHADLKGKTDFDPNILKLYPLVKNTDEAYNTIQSESKGHTSEDLKLLGMQKIRKAMSLILTARDRKYICFTVLSALYKIYTDQNFDLQRLIPLSTHINRKYYTTQETTESSTVRRFHEYVSRPTIFQEFKYSTSYEPKGGYPQITFISNR
jgi:hypothetical protein